MMLAIKYLMIGVVVGLILDMLNRNNPDESNRLNNKERIWILLFWPVMALVFVYHFIKAWFYDK